MKIVSFFPALLIFVISISCVEPSELEFTRSREHITFSLHDNHSQLSLPAVLAPSEHITINIPESAEPPKELVTATSTTQQPLQAAAPMTRLSVIRDICMNNKGVIITGAIGSISTAIVALVVHFTQGS